MDFVQRQITSTELRQVIVNYVQSLTTYKNTVKKYLILK